MSDNWLHDVIEGRNWAKSSADESIAKDIRGPLGDKALSLAQSSFNGVVGGQSSVKFKSAKLEAAISKLESLMDSEKDNELAFLQSQLGLNSGILSKLNPESPNFWKDLTLAFNDLFKARQMLDAFLQQYYEYMNKLTYSTKDGQSNRARSTYTSDLAFAPRYIDRALQGWANENITLNSTAESVKEGMYEAINNGLKNAFSAIDREALDRNNGEQQRQTLIQMYSEMERIYGIGEENPILKAIFDQNNLGRAIDSLKWYFRKNNNVAMSKKRTNRFKKDIKITGENRLKGTIHETLTTMFLQAYSGKIADTTINLTTGAVTTKAYHTGETGMKADEVLLSVQGQVDLEDLAAIQDALTNSEGGSNRKKNIERLQRVYDILSKINSDSFVVSVSNKIRIFGGSNNKIRAGKYNLQSFSSAAAALRINYEGIVDTLANSGAGMVGGNSYVEGIEQEIIGQVAQHMFDDIQIKVSGGNVKGIHLFNINGVYMSLSTYLNGVVKALKNIENMNVDSFVNVSISPKGATRPHIESAGDFVAYRTAHEVGTKINISFLKDFGAYLNSLVG